MSSTDSRKTDNQDLNLIGPLFVGRVNFDGCFMSITGIPSYVCFAILINEVSCLHSCAIKLYFAYSNADDDSSTQ